MNNFESRVHLYSDVPLSVNSNYTRYFSSESSRTNYFNNKLVDSYINMSMINPQNGQLIVDFAIGRMLNCNYLMFTNPSDNTEYYCFITEVDYVAEETTRISYQIDPIMTYMFKTDLTGHIEREHANYNNNNTLPEDVGVGDYVQINSTRLTDHATNHPHFAIVTTTTDLSNPEGYSGGTSSVFEHGIQQPYRYYFMPAGQHPVRLNNTILDMTELWEFNHIYAESPNLVNKIVNIQIVDTLPFNHTLTWQETGENTGYYNLSDYTSNSIIQADMGLFGLRYIGEINWSTKYEKTYTHSLGLNNTGDSRKLNNYPYSIIELTDGKNTLQFKPELIRTEGLKITENRSLETDCQVAYSVQSYADELSQLNRITKSTSIKLPVVSEELSAYIQSRDNAYLSNSLLQIGTGIGMIVATSGAMALAPATGGGSVAMASLLGASKMAGMGAITGGISGGLGATIDRYKSTEKAKRSPNNVVGSEGTIINGNLDTQMYAVTKTQTTEYKNMISDYFKVYGWKVLRNGKPNINTRTSFNFVKMNQCIVKGQIPQFAKESIMSMLMNGFTFWHVDDVGNYNLSNSLR